MTQIKNSINTYADLTAYNADLNKDFPNISYIQGTDEVKWNKYDPDHIVCVYNVTSTSSTTKLLNNDWNITYQIIDGVQQSSVQMNYTFDTLGEHIVKYKINGTQLGTGTSYVNGVFYKCTSLTSVTIPINITSIWKYVFRQCTSLITVNIPNTVTSIGDQVFRQCTSLTSVTIKATTPPTLDITAFTDTNNCPIYVPAESVNTYKEASGWSDYASRIQAIQ